MRLEPATTWSQGLLCLSYRYSLLQYIEKSILRYHISEFRTGVSISRFRIKDFPMKRRFSFPVLQLNNSLLYTILDVSCTNSEFFLHLRARKWRTQFNSGRLIWISENEAPVRNSINILCNCHLPTIQSMLTTWYKTNIQHDTLSRPESMWYTAAVEIVCHPIRAMIPTNPTQYS